MGTHRQVPRVLRVMGLCSLALHGRLIETKYEVGGWVGGWETYRQVTSVLLVVGLGCLTLNSSLVEANEVVFLYDLRMIFRCDAEGSQLFLDL